MSFYCTILSGGIGTRLWPLSRKESPKQYIKFGEHSLLQQAIIRNNLPIFNNSVNIILNQQHKHIAQQEVTELGVNANYLIEPFGRSTAPAILIAALNIAQSDPEAVLFVTPSDHMIRDKTKYAKDLISALEYAHKTRKFVIFGAIPNAPFTGYGYIECSNQGKEQFLQVESFKEKPSLETAKNFILSGKYFWNMGMFILPVKEFIQEFKALDPIMVSQCEKIVHSFGSNETSSKLIPIDLFDKVQDISIDQHFFERQSKHVIMCASSFDWCDLGSWDSVADNVVSNQKVYSKDSKHCYYNIANSNKVVCNIGADDLIVVDTEDVLLIAKRNTSQLVRDIVKDLNEHSTIKDPLIVKRPWGTYKNIAIGNLYKVKHIVVYPGAKISLQYHNHRSEHWVVVKGQGEVSLDAKTIPISEEQYVFIPKGASHRISNLSTDTNLELIEVQSGSYLEEDDIVRIEDIYGRA